VADVKPPSHLAGPPNVFLLPAGTVLFRVHQKQFAADAFNPVPSDRYYGGGRFDATEDDLYPFMYAGATVPNCIAETLLRDRPLDDTGARVLPQRKFADRRISAVMTTHELVIVSLRTGIDLGAVSQDPWLTWTEPRDYSRTRHWGHWIRGQLPSVQGYVWSSRREPLTDSYVLFGDRIPVGAIAETTHPDVPAGRRADFDTSVGRAELRRRLAVYNVTITRR
jgi:hypothetical protein